MDTAESVQTSASVVGAGPFPASRNCSIVGGPEWRVCKYVGWQQASPYRYRGAAFPRSATSIHLYTPRHDLINESLAKVTNMGLNIQLVCETVREWSILWYVFLAPFWSRQAIFRTVLHAQTSLSSRHLAFPIMVSCTGSERLLGRLSHYFLHVLVFSVDLCTY
jgi:hypothetical protein